MAQRKGEAQQPGAKTAAEFRAMDHRVQHATGPLVPSAAEQEQAGSEAAGAPRTRRESSNSEPKTLNPTNGGFVNGHSGFPH